MLRLWGEIDYPDKDRSIYKEIITRPLEDLPERMQKEDWLLIASSPLPAA